MLMGMLGSTFQIFRNMIMTLIKDHFQLGLIEQ